DSKTVVRNQPREPRTTTIEPIARNKPIFLFFRMETYCLFYDELLKNYSDLIRFTLNQQRLNGSLGADLSKGV
ncbi:MAG: hypothetical protein MUP26_01210, partial [Desulfobulbaceae bacterium]|nr:hypothetical protein [Desulfobulbaceae bacterium]